MGGRKMTKSQRPGLHIILKTARNMKMSIYVKGQAKKIGIIAGRSGHDRFEDSQ